MLRVRVKGSQEGTGSLGFVWSLVSGKHGAVNGSMRALGRR